MPLLRDTYFPNPPKALKQDFRGAVPNIFVGRYGYPNVNVGFLSNEGVTKEHDHPKYWALKNYEIPRIADLRAALINSRFSAHIKQPGKLVGVAQESALAAKPVDVHVNLTKKPVYEFTPGGYNQPHGPRASLRNVILQSNPRVPKAVERLTSDTDVKASTAMQELSKHVDNYYVTKLLSTGLLGKERRLVPTRWAITATDDTLGKHLIPKVQDLPLINQPESLHGGYLGNQYLILFFPGAWSYELFEIDCENGKVWTDHEASRGRTAYAKDTVGGYYAARIAILEYLAQRGRQASVLVFRFVTTAYNLPLGVWVVREAVRKAMQAIPERYSSSQDVIQDARKTGQVYYGYDIKHLLAASYSLAMQRQKTLAEY